MRSLTTPARPRSAAVPGWYQSLAAVGPHGWCVTAALLLAAGGFVRLLWAYHVPEGTLIFEGIWFLAAAGAIAVLCTRYGTSWLGWLARRLPFLVVVLLWSALSFLWSLEPARSLESGLFLLAFTSVAVYAGLCLEIRTLMTVLLWAFVTLLLASLALFLVLPEAGVQGSEGVAPLSSAWRGVTHHRADLGEIAASAAALFLIGALYGRLHPALAWPLLVAAVFMTLRSGSATALVALITCTTLIVVLAISKRYGLAYLTSLFIVLAAAPTLAYLVLDNLSLVTDALDRDPTLTNRVQVWTDAVELLQSRPWLGYGLQAVWGRGELTWFPDLATTRWAYHAHNGLVQVAAEVGLPAALAALVFLAAATVRAFRTYVRTGSAFALFGATYCVLFIVINLTEPRLFPARVTGCLPWLVLVATVVALTRSVTPVARIGDGGRRRQATDRRDQPAASGTEPGARHRHMVKSGPIAPAAR